MRDGSCLRPGWRRIVFACLWVFAVAAAQAAPPDRPPVSVHAGLKQLHFSWPSMSGATRYELWYLPLLGADWVKYAHFPANRTSVSVNVSAHLLLWNDARYVVKACNADGCGRSLHLFVSHLMQQSVGFFKPPADTGRWRMGWTTAISEDGGTLVAGLKTGGADVFRKTAGGWTYETRLMPDDVDSGTFGQPDASVAVNGDGTVIAIGVDAELPPDANIDDEWLKGAVYLFRRTAAGWIREQKFSYPDALNDDQFGLRLDLDDSGTLLAAWRRFGDTSSPNPPWQNEGQVELFRYAEGTWTRDVTVPAFNTRCMAMGLSGDGNTLVRGCDTSVDVFTAPDWTLVASLPNPVHHMEDFSIHPRTVAVNHDGTRFAARSVTFDAELHAARGWVNVFSLGANGWEREASIEAGAWMTPSAYETPPGQFAIGLALNRDGNLLAVGAPLDTASGAGVIEPPITGGQITRGAAYIYQRKPSGWWLRHFIKPNENAYTWPNFGWSLAFARNGKDLAIGAHEDASNATGVGGDQTDTSTPGRGAVWLY